MPHTDCPEAVLDEDCVELNIENIVHFFDSDDTGRKHASSIKGVVGEELAYACIKHYFASLGGCATLLTDKNSQRIACTTVSRPGFQLDGWLKIRERDVTSFYQTEIKSWSFHGYGSRGRRLPIFADDKSAAAAIKATNLDTYRAALNGEGGKNNDAVRKLLFKMKVPRPYTGSPEMENPRALLCVWEAVCEKGDVIGRPFFPIEVKPFKVSPRFLDQTDCVGGGFRVVHVFSVSNYLRSLIEIERKETIRLHLPGVAARIRILQGLFGT